MINLKAHEHLKGQEKTFTPAAQTIVKRQYLIDGEETIQDLFRRVANWVAGAETDNAEEHAEVFYNLMNSGRFSPGGRVLAGAGTSHGNGLNCFVQDGNPHQEGTTDYALLLARKLALVTKVGGGNGLNLDSFPPKSPHNIQLGEALITINTDHQDYENVRDARYMDLTKGQYITKPYQNLKFTDLNSVTADTNVITVPDSVEGIWDSAAAMVEHLLNGERVLLDLTELRPEGSPVKGSGGASSGPSSFAVEIFENFARWAALGGAKHAGPVATLRYLFASTLRVVRQGGTRRGAGMGTLSSTHPDLMDFITSKDHEREATEGDISTFNISVLVTDEFMNNPASGPTLRAIAEHAWQTGEPGMIFIDKVNEHNPMRDTMGDIMSTNPCVTGDTLILTEAGPRAFSDLAATEEAVNVWAVDLKTRQHVLRTMHRPHRTRQNTDILEITLNTGQTIKATPDHGFYGADGNRIDADDLTPGMTLLGHGENANPIVQHVTPAGTADVFNGMVDEHHNYIIINPNDTNQGLVSANCGEIPLYAGEPCDLGALNLAQYVHQDDNGNAVFNHTELQLDTHTAIRFLDNVLDVNQFALDENRVMSHKLRRLGLGIMGLADTLIKLGVRYDTDEGRETTTRIISTIRDAAMEASRDLAAERGAFPAFDESTIETPRRNVAFLTVAPTGTTSMMMDASGGVEPVYAGTYVRKIGTDYVTFIHPLLQEILDELDPAEALTTRFLTEDHQWDNDKIISTLKEHGGSIQPLLSDLPEDARLHAFVIAHDIHWRDHVLMQSTIQNAFDDSEYAGNSISKTINMANEATVEDILNAYALAFETGSKGITVYRDGSRQFQVLSTNDTKKEDKPQATEATTPLSQQATPAPATPVAPTATQVAQKYERPQRMTGITDRVELHNTSTGTRRSFFITVNTNGDQKPREVFIISGKGGDEANGDSEALGRLTSIALQYGVPAEAIIKTLRGISGGMFGTYHNGIVTSKADIIATALEGALGQKLTPDPQPGENDCPTCGGTLTPSEGCFNCFQCGYSRCS